MVNSRNGKINLFEQSIVAIPNNYLASNVCPDNRQVRFTMNQS